MNTSVLADHQFRARVLTPIVFMAMILIPASILAAIAVFGDAPSHRGGRVPTPAAVQSGR